MFALSKKSWGSRWLRVFFAALFAAYVVTWAWGVPAVITAIVENDMNANARAAEYYEEPWKDIDITVSFAFPLVPGLIVAHHSHEGGKLHGWGGWKVYLWYGTGETQVYERVTWVT